MPSKMGNYDGRLDPVWDDTSKLLGQLFMMGFEGTTVTPQVRSGSVILAR